MIAYQLGRNLTKIVAVICYHASRETVVFYQECRKRLFSLWLWLSVVSLGCGLPSACLLPRRACERMLVVPPRKRISDCKYSACWIFKTTDPVTYKLFNIQKKEKNLIYSAQDDLDFYFLSSKSDQNGPLTL